MRKKSYIPEVIDVESEFAFEDEEVGLHYMDMAKTLMQKRAQFFYSLTPRYIFKKYLMMMMLSLLPVNFYYIYFVLRLNYVMTFSGLYMNTVSYAVLIMFMCTCVLLINGIIRNCMFFYQVEKVTKHVFEYYLSLTPRERGDATLIAPLYQPYEYPDCSVVGNRVVEGDVIYLANLLKPHDPALISILLPAKGPDAQRECFSCALMVSDKYRICLKMHNLAMLIISLLNAILLITRVQSILKWFGLFVYF
ncbi:MAG: hypothetical protein K6F92_00440 [Lachnospiraceae bacterium]|nr:hypothetical protein [Lachnospiraceae bacterium]